MNVGRRGHVCGHGAKREFEPIFSTHTPLGCPAGRAASIRAFCFGPCLSFVVLKSGKVFFLAHFGSGKRGANCGEMDLALSEVAIDLFFPTQTPARHRGHLLLKPVY